MEEANQQLDNKVKNLHTMLETERKKNEKKQKKVRTITLVSYIVISLTHPKSWSWPDGLDRGRTNKVTHLQKERLNEILGLSQDQRISLLIYFVWGFLGFCRFGGGFF